MQSLAVRLLLSSFVLIFAPLALAHDVTLTGSQTFAALDGSSADHDGAANGVFTVDDGNLVVSGVVNCNDDGPGSNSACAMAFNVSGNLTINAGAALYAENRSGSGNGGAIALTVGGNLALNGTAIVSSAANSNGESNGGNITATVSGGVAVANGSTIDAGSANGNSGSISVAAGGVVAIDGNILSGPSRSIAATRLTGAALNGGNGNQRGGAITISTTTFVEPALVVGATANVLSQSRKNAAGAVTLEGCGVDVRGLVAAISDQDSGAVVVLRSGKDLTIDGRDLGGVGTRMGRVRADSLGTTAASNRADVFASETISILGPGGALFAVTANPANSNNVEGGLVRVVSTGDAANASGNAIDAGRATNGSGGGTIDIASKGDANLNTAVLRAVGGSSGSPSRSGGSISVRSYSGNVIWTNGSGDVRPVGSASGIPLANQGTIVLTACGTVNTTGSSYPTNGVATSMFPETHTGVCSPAAPSLPAGSPALAVCNTPPVANDTAATTNEDTTVTITLSGSDADGDSLTFTIVSGPSNGALGAVISTGPTTATVDYTPNLNYNGSDSFVFEANDGNGGTDQATASITIIAVNDPPTFLAGPTVSVFEDSGPQTVPNWVTSISPGPADESGQTVTFSVTNDNNALFAVQPAVAPDGTLTFTPAPNAYGSATITITAQDTGGTANGGDDTSNPQASSIIVNGVNDEPSFVAGASQTTNEDSGPQTVSGWATAISAGPNEGSQTVSFVTSNNNNALFSAQPAVSSSGTLTYTPAANANGSAIVTIYAQDDGGTANGGDDTSLSQTFTITVNAVNDEPSFVSGGNVTVLEDSGAYSASWATSISAGPADESGQTVTFSTSNDNNALFSAQPSVAPDGTLTFTPATNAFGSATVTVTLSDNGGTLNGGDDTSAPQTFVITVNAVNDEPSFTGGGNVTVNEDSGAYSAAWATAISAGPNESGQNVTFFASNNNNALFSVQPAIAPDGTLTFTPAANANGSVTVTVYAQDDGGTANGGDDTSPSQTFTITVNAVNDEPSFTSGGNVTVNEDSGAYSAAWASGISAGPADESGQTVTFSVSNDNNALFSAQPAIDANGNLTFTPATNAFGSATVTVTLSDNGGTANGGDDTSAPQTFVITVNGVNDEPSFTGGGNVTVNEDSGAYSAPWATSISAGPNESGQTLTFVTSNDNNALFASQPAVSASGVLTFTPAANAFGSATVTVYLTDDGGTANGGDDTSPSQTFVITVNAVNDAPSFTSGGNVAVNEDSGAYSAAWATSISVGPANESGQTVTFFVSNSNNALFSVQPSVDSNGVLTFTPASNTTGSATVTIYAQDNGGTANGGVDVSPSQTFTISVNDVNDPPTFTPGVDQSSNEDAGPQSVVWATSISPGPANESGQTVTFFVSNNNNTLFSAQPSIDSSGTLTYTAAPNANGSAIVTVYAQDNGGTANGGNDTSATYTFTITIGAVNDAPSFTGGGDVTVLEDSGGYSASWATAISAGPPDENGQTLTFNVTSNSNPSLFASGPSISATGVLSFTPALNEFGSATVTINLQDDGGTANGGADTSASYTFTITVTPVNDAPSFTPGGDVTVNEDSGPYAAPWATSISAGPANESGQTVTFNVSNNNNALFLVQPAISPTGLLTFTTNLNANGSAIVTVSLQDNGGTANGGVDTSATVQFTINVTAVNDAPTAGADAWDTLGNTELRVDLIGGLTPKIVDTTPSGNGVRDNDSDVEGDPFVVTGIVGCADPSAPFDCTLGDGSRVSMLANGSFSYTPGPGNTTGSFQYTVTDIPVLGTPASSTGTVTITILDMIWYVNGVAAPGGNGTSIAPFNSFASLNGPSGVGDVDGAGAYIFVHTSAVAGSIGLEANQKLWGEGVGLSTNHNLNGNGSPQVLVAPGVKPAVASSTDTVTVNSVTGVDIAGLSISSSAGNAIDITSNPLQPAAGVSIHDNIITGATLEGIDVNAGSTSGTTVLVNNTSITSTGNGFDVSSAGPANVAYSNGTITSTGGTGVRMDGTLSGNLNVSGLTNVTIDGNTAAAGISITAANFDAVPGGSADTVNGGTIAVGTAGNPVGGDAVVMVNVRGDYAIGSFTAYGTSGVSVTGTGLFTGSAGMRLSNTSGAIGASAGVGLSVTNATIGSANMNFTSINAAGALNGIVLNTTGTAGSLIVSGTGSADSGGIIQNTTEDGIRLTSTVSPSFSWMRIQNTGASGVRGTEVVNFTFANGTVAGSGNAVGESNINFSENIAGSNLSGNVSITNSSLTTAFDNGLRIRNGSGTLTNLVLTGNTFTSTTSTTTSKGSAVNVELIGSASTVASITKATLANNIINNFPSGAGIKVLGGNANAGGPAATVGASAVDVIAITNNQIAGFSTAIRMGTNAIETAVNGLGSGNFSISGNGTAASPLRNMAGAGITLSVFGNATASGSITNNVIVANNTVGSSGIATGADFTFAFTDTPNINVTVSGNSISNTSGNGILAGVRNSNGTGNFKITNNVVGAPTAGFRPGIRVDSGTAIGGDATLCLEITGNTTSGSGGVSGIGLRKEGTNPAVNSFGVVGMSATSSPGVEQYVDSLNSSAPAPFGDGDGVLLISATSGFTSCSLP